MLVNRRASRNRVVQRSDFREAQRLSSGPGAKATSANYIGQRSRFAAIEGLEEEDRLTKEDRLVIHSAKIAGNQATSSVPNNSAKHTQIRKDRYTSVKVKGKEPEDRSGRKHDAGPRAKSVYKPKVMKETCSTGLVVRNQASLSGPNIPNGGVEPIASSQKGLNNINGANGPPSVENSNQDRIHKVQDQVSKESSSLHNEIIPYPDNNKSMGKKNNKGQRMHNVVRGSIDNVTQQEPQALTEAPMELNSNISCVEQSSEHWDPNDDVAPDFMEANELAMAESHSVQRYEASVFPSLTFDLRDGFSEQVDRQGTVTIRFRGSWTGSRLALTECRYDEDAAVEFLNNNPGFLARPVTVVRAVTSTGSRVLAPTPVKQEGFDDSHMSDKISLESNVKEEPVDLKIEDRNPANVENGSDSSHGVAQPIEEFKVKKESAEDDVSRSLPSQTQVQESTGNRKSSWEAGYEEFLKASNTKVFSEEEYLKSTVEQPPVQASVDKVSEKKQVATPDSGEVKIVKEVGSFPCFQKSSQVKKKNAELELPRPPNVEDGEFLEYPDWFLAGRTIITALSTTKGRKLVDNEIVHFDFRSAFAKRDSKWILRISTKRSGEVGRVNMEWANEVVPLVRSAKVKIIGRCVAAPPVLQMMQDVMLCVSFYIHESVFTSEVNTSWRLDGSTYIDPSVYPLPTVFKLIEMKPYQNASFTPEELNSRKRLFSIKASFTPEELNSRKRLFSIKGNKDEAASDLPVLKRRKGCSPDQDDEQAVSQSCLNKLVGAAEVYDLEKQALYWMSELEKGTNAQNAENTVHPCWASYCINDERFPTIYVNNFTGEATTKLPTCISIAKRRDSRRCYGTWEDCHDYCSNPCKTRERG
ncbi:hypothetical protein K1719_009373 [Acacia pycnantha]|nr:hypothetical protein K1719_009373 [Acacia pycnantha]